MCAQPRVPIKRGESTLPTAEPRQGGCSLSSQTSRVMEQQLTCHLVISLTMPPVNFHGSLRLVLFFMAKFRVLQLHRHVSTGQNPPANRSHDKYKDPGKPLLPSPQERKVLKSLLGGSIFFRVYCGYCHGITRCCARQVDLLPSPWLEVV